MKRRRKRSIYPFICMPLPEGGRDTRKEEKGKVEEIKEGGGQGPRQEGRRESVTQGGETQWSTLSLCFLLSPPSL